MSSWRKHFIENKSTYTVAGGLALGALAAYWAYSRLRPDQSVAELPRELFPAEYDLEAGASAALSEHLGKAFQGSVDYDVKLWVQPQQSRFKGVVDVTFHIADNFDDDIYLSAHGLEFFIIRINDRKISEEEYQEMVGSQKNAVFISKKHLTKETIKLRLKFRGVLGSAYGLIGFIDQNSSSLNSGFDSYVFTSNSSFGTSAIFPVFESTTLRSTFRLSLIVPKEWEAISNEKSEVTTKDQLLSSFSNDHSDPSLEDFHQISFRQTKAIPYNALNIAAGPFKEQKTTSSILARKVTVYSIRSEANRVVQLSSSIGVCVKKSIELLEKLTGVKFPFSKVDILNLPEQLGFPAVFGTIPMRVNKEYPGLISLYLKDCHNFKAEFVFELVTSIAKIWFGNVITPESWSDVWFTEGMSRFVALKLMRENPAAFELTEAEMHLLSFHLKTQAIYLETQNDSTQTNLPLGFRVQHSFDVPFVLQSKAEKVGLFKLEEMFSFNQAISTFDNTIKELFLKFGWTSISADKFRQFYAELSKGDPNVKTYLAGCFDYQYLDEVEFRRTAPTTLTVQQLIRSSFSFTQRPFQIKVDQLSAQGKSLAVVESLMTDKPLSFQVAAETHTFSSILKNNSVYFEIYDQDELTRIFEVIKNNKDVSSKVKLRAARALFTNTLKSKKISLEEGFRLLKLLLTACDQQEQRWVLRTFSVIAKHIDKTKSTQSLLQDFVDYLIELTTQNRNLMPYLCYYGATSPQTRTRLSEFVADLVAGDKFDEKSSLLSQDLLKSCMLMIAFLRLDIDTASNYAKLVSLDDPATGHLIKVLLEHHAEDLVSGGTRVWADLKDIFSHEPAFKSCLDYYFKTLLIRTDHTEDMRNIRVYLSDIAQQPEKYGLTKKTLIYYNAIKFLSNATKDLEQQPDFDSSVVVDAASRAVDELVARRFTHHFRLA